MKNYNMRIFNLPELINIDKFFTMFIMETEGGKYSIGESHDFWECTYIMHGSVRVCINGRVYYANRGDLVLYKPMEFHQFFIDNDKHAVFFCFSFSLKSPAEYFPDETVYKLNSNQIKILENLIEMVRKKTDLYPYTEDETVQQISCNINFRYIKSLFALHSDENDMIAALRYIYRLFLDILEENSAIPESVSPHSKLFKAAVNHYSIIRTTFFASSFLPLLR